MSQSFLNETTASSSKQPAEVGNGSVELADILALQGLVDRVGAGPLTTLIDVMWR